MPAFIPQPAPRNQGPGPRNPRGKPRKTPADIRETFRRHHLRLVEAARLNDCKRLCALWHNEFGACLTLDTERLRALLRRLDDFTVEQIGWAILAYRAEVDTYRGEWAGRHKTLVRWLYDDRLEEYVTRGEALRVKQQAAAPRRPPSALSDGAAAATAAALFSAWLSLGAGERRDVLDRAVRELDLHGRFAGARDERNPLVRAKICQIMQRREVESERVAAPISAALNQTLS